MTKRPVPKYDFKTFGAAIKAARTGRKESRKKVSDEMFITPRSIMYIENRGQHTSLNAFYKLVTLFGISVDEFFYPDKLGGESERRKRIDRMLNDMDEKELIIIEGAAEGIRKATRPPFFAPCIEGSAQMEIKSAMRMTDSFDFLTFTKVSCLHSGNTVEN